MSGTSLDGLDIVFCKFWFDKGWQFEVLDATTVSYDTDLRNRLEVADRLSARNLKMLDNELGSYFGKQVKLFIKDKYQPDFIASHGHTIFHEPEKGYTLQIGNGANIAAESGVKTICDFRSVDVAMGGHGAPLVPIGDKLLFSEYSACLNLGGFSNISFEEGDKRIAYDICPVNIILNRLTKQFWSKEYDEDGKIGTQGIINFKVLEALNNLSYYQESGPKSLGKEWLEEHFIPILSEIKDPLEMMGTLYEHIAIQLAHQLKNHNGERVLITGGGAKNKYLIKLLRLKSGKGLVVPEQTLIDYKEALVFAYLGVLRMENEPNCLKSVTGAKKDSIGGTVYL